MITALFGRFSMMNTKNNTTILPLFFKYVSSNVLGMIAFSCYILADTFFIARGIGADALAALNLTLPAYSLMNGTGLMIGMGGASRYSLSSVRPDSEVHRSCFTRSLILAACAAFLFSSLGLLFPKRIALLLGAGEGTLQYTETYLRILMAFAPLFLSNNLLSSFVRNDGAPRLAMAGMLAGSFSNIILDYIFIYPLNLGMAGAALATATAPVIGMLTLSIHFLGRKNHFHIRKVAFSLRAFGDILSLGVSTLVTELSSGVVILVFNFLILGLNGSQGVAAYGILANIALVLVSIFTGIAQGIQPLISRSPKAHVRRGILFYAVLTSLAMSALSYIAVMLYAVPMADLFNKDHAPELTMMAADGMRIYFISLFFTGINIIAAAFLSAADRPVHAFVISLLRGLILILPAAWILSVLFGLTGVWMSVPVTEAIVCLVSTVMIIRQMRPSAGA